MHHIRIVSAVDADTIRAPGAVKLDDNYGFAMLWNVRELDRNARFNAIKQRFHVYPLGRVGNRSRPADVNSFELLSTYRPCIFRRLRLGSENCLFQTWFEALGNAFHCSIRLK